ncbi:hypothetical protein [Psychroserpens sp.]|uniref:hypothetical protein n=1 Tax=Psychroserpens sp. TaxID=2020870 RepID=UPI003857F9F9
MKRFLKKIAKVLFTFFLGLIAFVFIVHFTMKQTAEFSISENYNYLILGHSHPECAFNDSLIPNFKNLSNSGESYFYTYHKVKELIPKNNIDAIFIEYSNSLIRKNMDEWIWGYEKMNAYFPWHSPFMKNDDIWYLYKNNPDDFTKVVSTSTRNNFTRIISLDFITTDKKYGGFNKLEESKIPELLKEINTNPTKAQEEGISIANLTYLDKIIEYCRTNNVKVYLVRSPQHKYFPRENEDELFKIKNEQFGDIDFLDFDKFPLKDNQFGDLGHLNYKGANVFSSWFNSLIENGLLSIDDKKTLIEKEIENLTKTNSSSENL